MILQLERTLVQGRRVLRVHGELDLAAAPELTAAVDAELALSPGSLCLDLTGTTFLDSSGLRALVQAARRGERLGSHVYVLCPRSNTPLQRIFGLVQLGSGLTIVDSLLPDAAKSPFSP